MIIEMVGICGAGKSTLLSFLNRRDKRFRKLPPPNKVSYIPFIIKMYVSWFPDYVKNYKHTRWFTLDEIRTISYLGTWLPYLQKMAEKSNIIATLDPGAIYWLSVLREYGPEYTKSFKFKLWWKEMFHYWMNGLDVIVWLDAPDHLLYNRVISRNEWHEILFQKPEEALSSFPRYRTWYRKIIKAMTLQRDLKVYCYHTDQITTEAIADHLLAELKL